MTTRAPAGVSAAALVPAGLDATLVFVRHGETDLIIERRFQGRLPATLSALGRRQAAFAGARVADPARPPALPVPPGAPRFVAHSPLRRTAETAQAIEAALGARGLGEIPLVAVPGLAEIGQGVWEGLTVDEVVERYGPDLAAWRRRPHESHPTGGESLAEVDTRARAGVRPLLDALADGREPGTLDRSQVIGYGETADPPPWAVLVGHDGCFKIVLLALLELPLTAFWRFPFALASISVVEIRGGRASLRLHNAIDHLAPLESESAAGGSAPERPAGAL